ncbi:S8 family serine peptidase [Ornithinibacillus sp. L9]|uniref:S8 family serine peptidase n=1 Tax=Ornithinibacillus caprae TaxID=2678566 RepID=A0A6N8FD28_9BACI|nr:S8 family serine peptidase [Ornithinibacillus caprae]MUK87572.1 S8 family serine peptidase [Ornithinibacillus caprae]
MKKQWFKAIILAICFALIFPFSLPQQISASNLSEEKVIILFEKNIDKNAVANAKGKVNKEFNHIPAVSMSVSPLALKGLKNNPNVRLIEEDQKIEVKGQVLDWGIEKTATVTAWRSGLTGKGVKIAVVDTGIAAHEDLSIAGGISVVNYTPSYSDDHGHGTHVAGIIGAQNNELGIVGTAPDSDIFAVKALDYNGSGYLSDIIAGIDWSISNQMDIINLSLGTSQDSVVLKQAIDQAYQKGILVISAAGNSGNKDGSGDTVNFPAKYPTSIAVAAVDSNNQRGLFSSTGEAVEISAPGVNVVSTYLGNQYIRMNGTSMAAPFVSGIIALYLQENPHATIQDVRSQLQTNVIDLGVEGRDSFYGYGLIQAPQMKVVPVGDEIVTEPSQPEIIEQAPNEEKIIPLPPAKLSNPSNFKSKKTKATTVELGWNKVSGAKKYEVKRNGKVIYRGTKTRFVDKKLKRNKVYTYEIIAIKDSVKSNPTKLRVKTLKIDQPTSFKSTSTKATTVGLDWNKVSGAKKYEVKRNGKVIYRGTKTRFVDKKLKKNKTYKYEVRAINTSGKSKPTTLKVKTKKK